MPPPPKKNFPSRILLQPPTRKLAARSLTVQLNVQEVLFVNTITGFQLTVKWKLNITKDTKVTVLGLQESTFPFLQEEEYDFQAQQTSETIKYMHYVHGSTSSFHLSVLMLDTKKLLYLPLSPWKLLSPLCPVLYQQFSLTKSDKYTVNPNLCSVSEYWLIGK